MKASTALRTAVIAQIAIMFLSIGASLWLERRLPAELAEFLENQPILLMDDGLPPLWRGLLIGVAFIMTALGLAGYAGLLMLKRWGAWLYLISWLVAMPLYFTTGYQIYHPLEQICSEIVALSGGMIIALAFFSQAIPRSSRGFDGGSAHPLPGS